MGQMHIQVTRSTAEHQTAAPRWLSTLCKTECATKVPVIEQPLKDAPASWISQARTLRGLWQVQCSYSLPLVSSFCRMPLTPGGKPAPAMQGLTHGLKVSMMTRTFQTSQRT